MQRTKLRNGMEVQVATSRWTSEEAIIVSTDVDFAHRVSSRNGVRSYRFDGAWNQAIAIAVKRDDGTWRPRVTTTRKVLGGVEEYKIQKAADDLADKNRREDDDARRALAEANRTARLLENPAVVDALNEFVGSDQAFSMSYNGHIVANSTNLVSTLAEALELEVL